MVNDGTRVFGISYDELNTIAEAHPPVDIQYNDDELSIPAYIRNKK